MSPAAVCFCLLSGLTLLGGCNPVEVHSSHDVLLRQSAPQTLLVVNKTNRPLTYGPAASAAVLAPGGHLTLTFLVNTIGVLKEPKGTPYWTILPDRHRESFIETDAAKVIEDASDPLKITFHDGAIPVFTNLTLSPCQGVDWATAPNHPETHTIAVPDPIPSIPQLVCPSSTTAGAASSK